MLAERCDRVLAYDFERSAVTRARERVRRHRHVDIVSARFPDWRPSGRGDLVVLSEVAYYLGPASAARAIELVDGWLDPDGTLVAVHFTGTTDYPRHGSEIGPWLDAAGFLTRTTTIIDESFELGVWRRTST
jgi:cyclopropane fatty-acyl-phospholipid synthase-like methyltransferase